MYRREDMRGSITVRGVIWAALGILAVLFFAWIINQLNPSVKTLLAVRVSHEEMIGATGYFIRDETVMTGGGGEIEVIAANGAKVKNGAEVARVYDDYSDIEVSHQARELDSRIATLQDVREHVDEGGAEEDSHRILENYVVLANFAHKGVTAYTETLVSEIETLVFKREYAYERYAQLDEVIEDMQQERSALPQTQPGTAIHAEQAGYFLHETDGYETRLIASGIDNLTLDMIDAPREQLSVPENAIGKIVSDFSWYFAAPVSEEQAVRLTTNMQVSLRAGFGKDVAATVYKISPPVEGRCLLILKGTDMRREILSMRRQRLDIIIRTFKGVSVPKAALRMQSGVMGVYVMIGVQTKWKPLNPVYETEEYYIVEEQVADKSLIMPYDEVVISAKGLEDKKIIN